MKSSNDIYRMDGLGKVFSFTISQTFKNRAYRVSFIVFILMLVLMGPINYLGAGAGADAVKSTDGLYGEDAGISRIHLVNDTHIPFTAEMLGLSDTAFAKAVILEEEELPLLKADELGIRLSRQTIEEETTYMLDLVMGEGSELTEGTLSSLGQHLTEQLALARRENASLTDEQLTVLSSGVQSGDVLQYEEYLARTENSITNSQLMSTNMLYCVIVMILGSLSSSYVVSSVMEEKTSKLVENLLVSVRPMALVFGKILAVMSYIGLMLVIGVCGSAVSNKIAASLAGSEAAQEVGGMLNFSRLFSMGGWKSALLIFCMILTYLQFAILAGLLGSACVKQEDAQSAIGTVTLVNMAGYFVGIFITMADSPVVKIVCSVIPILSGYTAPVFLVCGKIPLWSFLLGMALNIVVIILLFRICARTYRKLIVNDSKRLNLGEIIRLSAGKEGK